MQCDFVCRAIIEADFFIYQFTLGKVENFS